MGSGRYRQPRARPPTGRGSACIAPDREHVIPAADEQDGFTAGMADELAAVGKVGEGDALGEIGTARLG